MVLWANQQLTDDWRHTKRIYVHVYIERHVSPTMLHRSKRNSRRRSKAKAKLAVNLHDEIGDGSGQQSSAQLRDPNEEHKKKTTTGKMWTIYSPFSFSFGQLILWALWLGLPLDQNLKHYSFYGLGSLKLNKDIKNNNNNN